MRGLVFIHRINRCAGQLTPSSIERSTVWPPDSSLVVMVKAWSGYKEWAETRWTPRVTHSSPPAHSNQASGMPALSNESRGVVVRLRRGW